MRVDVDLDACVGSGSCANVCPEVFELGDDGYLRVLEPEPGEALRSAVEDAVELCPTGAITAAD